MTFRALAFLLTPAEPGRPFSVVEVDQGWGFDPSIVDGEDVLLWGRPSLPSGIDRRRAVRSALARERRIRGLRRRPPRGMTLGAVHRLPPARLQPGSVRNRLRDAALGGALLEFGSGHGITRVMDEVARAADVGQTLNGFRPGSGGAALALVEARSMVLRMAQTGTPGDPGRAAEGLAALMGLDLPVPRLLGRGQVAGASWSAESILPGTRPRRITAGLTAQVAGFCARLPRSDRPAESPQEDLRVIAATFSGWRRFLDEVAAHVDHSVRRLPSIVRHGDLWAGNLLVNDDSMTGAIDWDAWHPSGVPGTDLLHFVATEERRAARRGLGSHWLERPWRSEAFEAASTEYWSALGVRPDREALDAIGVAWWATQVASSLTRLPELAEDRRWVTENVEDVLSTLGR